MKYLNQIWSSSIITFPQTITPMENKKFIFYPKYIWHYSYAAENQFLYSRSYVEEPLLYNPLAVEFVEVSVSSQGLEWSFFHFPLNITDQVEEISIFKV